MTYHTKSLPYLACATSVRWRAVFLGMFAVFFAISLPGCGSPSSTAPAWSKDEARGESETEPKPALVAYGDWPDLREQVLADNRFTVIDFWSLSCQPCLQELPNLAKLQNQHADQVKCVGVSLDFDGRKSKPPESYEERITEVMTKIEAGFTTFICETPSDDMYAALDIPSIPAVFVYDQSGKLVKKFVDAGDTAGFTYEEDVIPFLVESGLQTSG